MSTRRLLLYEDRDWRTLSPLTDLTIVPALVFGAATLAERWHRASGLPLWAIEARSDVQHAAIDLPARDPAAVGPDDEAVVVNAAVMTGDWFGEALSARAPALFVTSGRVAGARLPAAMLRGGVQRGEDFETVLLSLGLPTVPVTATFFERPWQLFERNAAAIVADLADRRGALAGGVHRLAALENPEAIEVEAGAEVGAFAVLDAREGPILVARDARVASHTVVVGPCVIGAGTQILSGVVSRSTFGPQCRVAGEVEECVWQGYANKRHHGFVGHSWIGEWANLGALTTTSDLKNNYGEVRVVLGGRPIATGSRKIGSLIGAHVKTGIGTLLPTGAVIGTGSNLFGGGIMAPKSVASFSWWDGQSLVTHEFAKFLATARIAFSRRDRTLSAADESVLRNWFNATAAGRPGSPLP